ncbi:hypothetical protein FDUTEX481_06874 [Tolypothrix sp. PCC 7601]|nr:hypothetical protein FDUTEX481_06874 [Tolypothrix sp. PCC 7601]
MVFPRKYCLNRLIKPQKMIPVQDFQLFALVSFFKVNKSNI